MIEQVGGDFRRMLNLRRGYDCRESCVHEVKGAHGIGGVELLAFLVGPAGAVQFRHLTNWYPASVDTPFSRRDYRGVPADLGYHAREPQYDGQPQMERCDILWPDDPDHGCYYDGSGLNAEPVFEVLVNGGDEALWEYLLRYYRQVFHGEGTPPQAFGETLRGFADAMGVEL